MQKQLCLPLKTLIQALLVVLLMAFPAMAADAIEVEINKSKMYHLPAPASVIAVADPTIADVEVIMPDLVSIQGRGVGETTIIAFDDAGRTVLDRTVNVSHNVSKLQKVIRTILPDANVKFESIDGALVLSGTVSSPLEAENVRRIATPFLAEGTQLVNMMTVLGSDQVALQVRVAEVSRTELERFGINLASALTSGNFVFGLLNGRSLGAGVRNLEDGTVTTSYSSNNVTIDGVIDALKEDNLIRVLAEPNLTTASGRTASFLAGGEIPIPVPADEGNIAIEWREYGVRLEFTPEVLSKDKISLTVSPEVSELSQIGSIAIQGFNIPSLTTRRAQTTVELGSGQSFAIAGLLQHDVSNDISKFPGLGDIPILGALFRSSEFRQEQTELMILITPYIVRGVPSDQLIAPTDGYEPANDAERLLLGRHHTPEKRTPPPSEEPAYENERPLDVRRRRFSIDHRMEARPRQEPMELREAPATTTAPSAPTATKTAPKPQPKPSLNGPVGFMLR